MFLTYLDRWPALGVPIRNTFPQPALMEPSNFVCWRWGPTQLCLIPSFSGDVETKQNTTTFTVGGDVASQQNGNIWASENAIVSLSLNGTFNVFDPRDNSSWRKIHASRKGALLKPVANRNNHRDRQKLSPLQHWHSSLSRPSSQAPLTGPCGHSTCLQEKRMLSRINPARVKFPE